MKMVPSLFQLVRSSGSLANVLFWLHLAIMGELGTGCRDGDVVVMTDRGPVIGHATDGVQSFLGIPYAAAPVGPRRWKAPAPVSWTDLREAKEFGPRCFGVSFLDSNTVRSGASEDCLSLNIWSPTDAVGKPVLFWIHGGGFIDGTSGEYVGEELARTGDVVVVTANYRLGALGTLSIPSADGGGNLGLLDQQFALRWVQRNISAFGGDPAKITIAGQSAGAQAVCAHASIPSSQGLFRAIIMESGNCDVLQTPATASATAHALAEQWGCLSASNTGPADTTTGTPAEESAVDEECLRALPAETVVRGNLSSQVVPIVDGVLLPSWPRAAMAAGTFANVPVLAGFNANEGYFFTDTQYSAFPLTSSAEYSMALSAVFGALAPVLESAYPVSEYDDDPRRALAELFRDGFMECPSRHLIASNRLPAYVYSFDYSPRLEAPKPVLAMHTVELPFLWGGPLPWIWWQQVGAGVPSDQEELDLARTMKVHWTNFVRALDPSPGDSGVPKWPAWSAGSQAAMRYSLATSASSLAANPRCALWDQVFGGGT